MGKRLGMNEVFEKIIEKLEACKDTMLSPKNSDCFGEECKYNDCTVCVFAKAIEIVKQEAEQYNNGWIPVSDHIPMPAKKSFGNKRKRTNVLVTLRNGLVKEMTFEFEKNEFWEAGDDNHIKHWKEDAIDTDVEVIAWQPLPQPYQMGE